MALTAYQNKVNAGGRELLLHGTAAFPVGCYYDDLHKEAVPWHWHPELEAVVVASGTVCVAIGEEHHHISAGDGFFINTNVLHALWPETDDDCFLHSVVFHPRLVGGFSDSIYWHDFLQPLLDHPALPFLQFSHTDAIPSNPGGFSKNGIPDTGSISDPAWHADAIGAILTAWTCCAEEPSGYVFHVRAQLSQLIFLLRNHLPSGQVRPSQKRRREEARIKEMLQYIHIHYADEMTVSDIAGSAGVSESECLRCFRSAIGMPPVQYLKQFRILEAQKLLASTDRKIADIGISCGFRNTSYFTKSFRELKGCTPGDYRKLSSK